MMLGMDDILCELEREDVNEQGLPPGFRFHPTDEELITFYLASKVFHATFQGVHIAEVDLNRCEPWDLPDEAKMGEREWYFFSLRDRKYPTGLRTNRATGAGYWKATGKDREVYSASSGSLLGMKKTLVFYRGRAPRGEKTKWVMHEYRLDGDFSCRHTAKEEWVICRIFHKMGEKKCSTAVLSNNNNNNQGQSCYLGKQSPIPNIITLAGISMSNSQLPPLLEPSQSSNNQEQAPMMQQTLNQKPFIQHQGFPPDLIKSLLMPTSHQSRDDPTPSPCLSSSINYPFMPFLSHQDLTFRDLNSALATAKQCKKEERVTQPPSHSQLLSCSMDWADQIIRGHQDQNNGKYQNSSNSSSSSPFVCGGLGEMVGIIPSATVDHDGDGVGNNVNVVTAMDDDGEDDDHAAAAIDPVVLTDQHPGFRWW